MTRINANMKPKKRRFHNRRDSGFPLSKALFFDSRHEFAGKSSQNATNLAYSITDDADNADG
jgi:hypothetical protein